MYSKEQRETALQLYDECQSVTKVIQPLGYPSRQGMHKWLKERTKPLKEKANRKRYNNPKEHPLHPSAETKLAILERCFINGENVQLVSEETGYSRTSIYRWRKLYVSQGAAALMNEKDRPRGELEERCQISSEEIRELKQQMHDMQMEIDILRETLKVIKKDPGVNWGNLNNREKTTIVDALKNRYSLSQLLSILHLSRGSYYYQELALKKADKYAILRLHVVELFNENRQCYGYRRINALLRREGITVSEKVIRRIMREESLVVNIKRRKKYNSYQGEISPAVPNLIQRDFHAEQPNVKWLTDITEFAIPAGKVYLSPIVDCFDGMITSWSISVSPDAKLVNDMLDKAIGTLKSDEHPILHSDRGCHYRWPGWIKRTEKKGLTRSMSKKGCTGDNAACEGFFGRLKNEMFYNRDWSKVSIHEFKQELNQYISWYNENRIKSSLGNLSPMEYRQKLGFAA